MSEYSRVYAKIDLDHILFNMESMHNRLKDGTQMIAVVKTDGYGHGAKEIAGCIESLPYLWGFAVATVDEAMVLRKNGIKKPILILGITFPNQFEQMICEDIRPAVCDYGMAKQLSETAIRLNKDCRIHIKGDTGMSRIGFQVRKDNVEIVEQISGLSHIIVEGIFTHFAKADETDKSATRKQMERFDWFVLELSKRGVDIPLKHCSNSAGIIDMPEANYDMVRAGITLYGLWPSDEVNQQALPLKPAMSLRSHVSFVKELEPNVEISYGGTYVTDRVTRLATIPVGYGDGYARGLSNKGYVLIHGKKAPICGRVCMDQFMVDVTDIPDVKPLDPVTLLGTDGKETITLEQLGDMSGRFNYEFACLITNRVPRLYYLDKKLICERPACIE